MFVGDKYDCSLRNVNITFYITSFNTNVIICGSCMILVDPLCVQFYNNILTYVFWYNCGKLLQHYYSASSK